MPTQEKKNKLRILSPRHVRRWESLIAHTRERERQRETQRETKKGLRKLGKMRKISKHHRVIT